MQEQLKLTFTPEEYLALITSDAFQSKIVLDHNFVSEYWSRLPWYKIAQCPICGAAYSSVVNTHSIHKWHTSAQVGGRVFSVTHQKTGCEHFVSVQVFFNLNGFYPTETNYFDNESGDVPVITRELLEMNGQEVYAVMSSFPVCRIENGVFVPRYSVYTLTYYAQEAQIVKKQRNSQSSVFFRSSGFMKKDPQSADLEYWVKQGKLYWLDLDDPTLPLRKSDVSKFPYAGIQGYGRGFTYRNPDRPVFVKWLLRESPKGYFIF